MAKQRKPNPCPPKVKSDPIAEMIATCVQNTKDRKRNKKLRERANQDFRDQYAASLKAPPTINK